MYFHAYSYKLIVFDFRDSEQIYALFDQILDFLLAWLAIELLVPVAGVCLSGLPGEVLAHVLKVVFHMFLYLFEQVQQRRGGDSGRHQPIH